jgi:hypothetical protein
LATLSPIPQHLEAAASRRWALWLMVATGCGSRGVLNLHATDSSVSLGGDGLGGASGGGGNGETGGSVGRGGALGSGGDRGSGGLNSSGGVARTGGTGSAGGVVGSGGTLGGGAGGSSSSGGTAGETGDGVYGLPCTTNVDCPSDAICCDGSDPGCDGTRLPTGDGGNPGEFIISADGLTVTDTITGLVWQQDDSGPRAGCTGTLPDECSWQEAEAYCASLVLGGVSGWRLPTWKELLTLVDVSLTPDADGFPGNPYGSWTSSLNAGNPYHELYIDFGDGTSLYCQGVSYWEVLCVRGSRCYPKSRFVVLDGGLVRDKLTDLVWQQQGSTTKMTWTDAQSYCSSLGSGFRLPTLRELDSLVDPTTSSGPTMDGAFPSTGTEKYWTSSRHVSPGDADPTGYARYGDFSSIDSNDCMRSTHNWSKVTDNLMVRCVR